jgi:APA family basic amino acid/polyamine antiporter
MKKLIRTKSVDHPIAESKDDSHGPKRVLTRTSLISLGIGAVIETGIFVLTGHAAADFAGPAVALSYVLSGLGCLFAALCDAEYSASLPISGSAYTYATSGEFMVWSIFSRPRPWWWAGRNISRRSSRTSSVSCCRNNGARPRWIV